MHDPTCPRHHRPRPRGAVRVRLRQRPRSHSQGHPLPGAHSASRRQLVRRWGVDFLYGTSAALCGLHAAGESGQEPYILRAGEWLRTVQNGDGAGGKVARATTWDALCRRRAPLRRPRGRFSAAGERRHNQPQPAQGNRVFGRDATALMGLGTRIWQRHGISEGLLPHLPPLTGIRFPMLHSPVSS